MITESAEISKALDRQEGTIEFKSDDTRLFSKVRGSLTIIETLSENGESGIRLLRTSDEELVFQHLNTSIGLRECSISLEGFGEFKEFRVFLVWSPEEIRLHIGPANKDDSIDLRTASTSEVISNVKKNEAGRLVAPESKVEIGAPDIDTIETGLSPALNQITKYFENSVSQAFVEDFAEVLKVLYENNAKPNGNGLTKSDIAKEIDETGANLDVSLGTILQKLYDADFVDRYLPPGPEFYVVSERRDEIINGEVDLTVNEEISSLLSHIQEDKNVREVVATSLDIEPDEVENYLQSPNTDKIDALNKAVEVIEESNKVDKRPSYGKISFVHAPYRYTLTEKSYDLLH